MARPRLNRSPLTKRAIDAAKAADRDWFLWDGAEHGLGVKVTPTGAKIFILQKSIRQRVRRLTLGHHGDVTLDAARRRARELNGLIASGHDPVADERERRAAAERQARLDQTVADLWQRYAVEILPANKPRTAAEKTRMWDRRIAPALGKLKLQDVTDRDAGEVVRAPLKVDAHGRITGGRAEAGNLYRLMHHMFHKALLWKLRPLALGSPLDGVTAPKVPRRERLLTAGEVGALMRTLDQAAAEESEPGSVVAAIKAAILTGARISELLGLRWADVRRDELELHLPDTKTGFSRRPISADALATIEGNGRVPGSPYVFRAPDDPTAPLGYDTVERAFRRLRGRAGVANCSLHTVRHWFSTMTANSVSNPRVGMALTGHRSHAAYMGYIHSDRDQARKLAEEIGAFTSSLAAGGNVVPIRKAGER